MAIVVNNKFNIGDTVYLVTDIDQLPRLVIAMKIWKEGEVMYELIQGVQSSLHYAFEITTERNILVEK